jgi:hypothetical protein
MALLLLSPETVGPLLRRPESRNGALDALEAHTGAHDTPLAVAAAGALTDLLSEPADTGPAGRIVFRRAGLMRARLAAEAADPGALWHPPHGAYCSENSVFDQIISKAPPELQKEDAVDLACLAAMEGPASRYGWTACHRMPRDGFFDYMLLVNSHAKATDAKVLRLAEMLLELLSEPEKLPDDLMRAGAWTQLINCTQSGRGWKACNHLVKLDIFALLAAELRRAGGSSGADWLFADRCRSGVGHRALLAMINLLKARAGEAERPDVKAWVQSGVFDLCLAGVEAFACAGPAAVVEADPCSLLCCVGGLRQYHLRVISHNTARTTLD